uniref:GroES-like zinc-binding alcohol dehydrogenase family protein n=1 Tax=Citrus limon TaxID=2708 RepID=A0A1S8ACP9_CITLI
MWEEGTYEDNPPPVTYKETLVGPSQFKAHGVEGSEEDWEFEEGDVTENCEGVMPYITFSARIQEKLIQPWKNSVVVKLLGKNIGYRALCARLASMWKPSMGFSVIDLENNYYLIRFRAAGDAIDALTKGSWIILGHYLTVQPWTLDFDSKTTDLIHAIVWIRLPGLAMHLYHQKTLQKIGHLVEEVIKFDDNTELSTRGKFTRIAVQISLVQPLVSQVKINGRVQKIEYEGLPFICFKCGRYGHHSDICSSNTNDGNPTGDYTNSQDQQRAEMTEPQEDKREEATHLEPFGPWMIASKRGRRPNAGKENSDVLNRNKMQQGNHASRFQVLTQIPEETSNGLPTEPHVLPDIPGHFQATNSNSNPSTITFKANLSKSATRRQQRKKAAMIIQNRPEASTSNNPFQNTDSIQDLSNSHINVVHYNSHANPRFIFCPFTHATSANHITKSIPITLDPTKHTTVFCSPQPNTPPGQNSDTNVWPATGQHDQPPPHSSHPNDPPDDMSGFITENIENDFLEHALTKTDVVENGMSEDEESMV